MARRNVHSRYVVNGGKEPSLKDNPACRTTPSLTDSGFLVAADKAPVGIFRSTPQGRYEYANPCLATMYGYDSPEDLVLGVGDIFTDVYADPEDRFRLMEGLNGDSSVSDFRCRIRRRDGSIIWTSRNVRAELGDDGQVLFYEGYVFDITDRVQAREKYRRNRVRHREVLNNIHEGVWLISAENTVDFVNKSMAGLLGYDPGELVGKPVMDLIHPDGRDMVKEKMAQRRKGKVDTYEFEYGLKKDGSTLPLLIRSKPLMEDDGRFSGILATMSDLTDSRQIERERRLTSKRFQALYEMTRQGGKATREVMDFVLDKSLEITESPIGYIYFLSDDEKYLHLYSWSKGVMDQCRILEYPEAYKVSETGLWGEAVRHRKPIITNDYENSPLRRGYPKGHVPVIRHMNVPVFDEGRIVALAGVGNKAEDYTEDDARQLSLLLDGMWGELRRREDRERLDDLNHKNEVILNVAADGIFGLDVEGMNVFVNPAAGDMLGYEASELVGVHNHSLCHHVRPDGSPYPVEDCPVHATLSDGLPREGEDYFVRRDKTMFPVQYKTRAMIENDHVVGAVVTFEDITERKLSHKRLTRAKEQAEAASQAKSQFLSNMSHELRTPLNGIMGMGQLLLGSEISEDMRQFVEVILQSSKNLLHIVNNLLELSAMESGKIRPEPRPMKLRSCLRPVAAVFARQCELKGIAFSMQIADDVPDEIIGDQARLNQILVNLLDNALRFTDKGEVEVLVSLTVSDAETGRERLEFVISDTGKGIPQDRLEKVFDSFALGEDVLTKRHGQAGVGLTIARNLVEMMGGNIQAESEPDQGSVFSFTLPLGRTALEDMEAGEPVQVETSPSLKVLVVEDEAVNRLVTSRFLERMGYAVTAVEDGVQALDAVKEAEFDLVLMDIQMPRINGLEATRRILNGEAGERGRTLPIVALTAYAGDDERAAAFDAGMVEFLLKPFDFTELDGVIRRHAGVN